MNFLAMMELRQNFINTFLMNLVLSFKKFMASGEALEPWMLFLEQESYLSYIKKVIKKTIGNCKLQRHVLQFLRIEWKKQIQ